MFLFMRYFRLSYTDNHLNSKAINTIHTSKDSYKINIHSFPVLEFTTRQNCHHQSIAKNQISLNTLRLNYTMHSSSDRLTPCGVLVSIIHKTRQNYNINRVSISISITILIFPMVIINEDERCVINVRPQ